MTSACLAVVAALGASFLTGLAALGVTAFREWLGGRAADRDALDAAVTEMLSRSMGISLRANTMAHTMRLRSGLGEGIDVLTHHRKPLDPLEFHDWLAQDQAPLNASWSVIWARGNQETIRRANALLAACTDLTGAGTSIQAAATLRQRLKRNVVGSTWTEKNARPSATPCGSLPTPVRTPQNSNAAYSASAAPSCSPPKVHPSRARCQRSRQPPTSARRSQSESQYVRQSQI